MAHEHEKLIKCPYCDHEWEDSWEFDDDEGVHTCGSCGKEFNVVRNTTITYSTSKVDCDDKHDKHDYQIETFHVLKKKLDRNSWVDLPEDNWSYVRIDQCSKCDDKKYNYLTKEEYYDEKFRFDVGNHVAIDWIMVDIESYTIHCYGSKVQVQKRFDDFLARAQKAHASAVLDDIVANTVMLDVSKVPVDDINLALSTSGHIKAVLQKYNIIKDEGKINQGNV